MTFKNRKGPGESQICRQTVPGSRIGDNEGAVVARCVAGIGTSAVHAGVLFHLINYDAVSFVNVFAFTDFRFRAI